MPPPAAPLSFSLHVPPNSDARAGGVTEQVCAPLLRTKSLPKLLPLLSSRDANTQLSAFRVCHQLASSLVDQVTVAFVSMPTLDYLLSHLQHGSLDVPAS